MCAGQIITAERDTALKLRSDSCVGSLNTTVNKMTNAKIPVSEIPEGADPEVYQEMVDSGEITHTAPVKPDEHIDDDPELNADGTKKVKPADDDGEDKNKGKNLEDEDGEKKPINREVQHIPAWKHKEDVKKAKEEGAREAREAAELELKEKLKAAGEKPGGATEDDATAIAEEFGIKPEVVGAFLDRMSDAVKQTIKVDLSPEDRAALDTSRESARVAKENEGFEKEWGDSATQTALKAVAGDRQITEEVRSKIKKLAYTSTYNHYRLADIIALEGPELFPKGSKSGESGRGGAARGQESKTIEEMSPDEILNMSDDDFAKLSDELGGKGSRFVRTTVPKK